MNDPSSPQGQALAESRRRKSQRLQEHEEYSAAIDAERKLFEEAKADYYQALKEKYSDYSDMGWNFSDEAYRFIDAAQPIIKNSADPQYMKERLAAADKYSDLFGVSFETAFLNLEDFHQQWMGQNFVKKTGWKALADSLQLNFVSAEYNRLSKELAKSEGKDPDLLQAIQEHERMIDRLRDHAPKVWQDDYVKMGGWHDVGQALRSVTTMLAENAGPIATGIGAAAVASTGIGAIAGATGLSSAVSGLLVAGASRAAIAGSTYHSTWGIKYREMTSEGIPHDIALSYAKADAAMEGLIEGMLGGVESAGAKAITGAVVPRAVGRATSRWFISGKMSLAAKSTLNWLKEGFEEGSEELLQGISSGKIFNEAADAANARREEKLREIVGPQFDEIRKELEKEIDENYPEVSKKEWGDILDEAVDGAIGGFLTGLILGIPIERVNYKNNVRAASMLAEMAQAAPNEAVFNDMIGKAKEQGYEIPFTEGMKTDEEAALLSDIYKVQQERMTPEQREAKQKEAEDAAALAEVTDYRNTETTERIDEDTGETITELAAPDTENIYRENDRLEITEYTDVNEDGSINGRFVAGDPRIDDKEQTGANQYGYINYTGNGDTVTIDEFKMMSGYENLRSDLYSQFAEKFAGREITWNPEHEQNIAIRDQLVNNNRRGPKYGLNYYEKGDQPQVSNEARQVAQRFTPYMKQSTPLEIALAAEAFGAFYRRRGESLNGAMNRLLGNVTNTAPAAVRAAQREGKFVKGATWLEQTAEGMKRIVYLNKNASDASTVLHETSHAVANDFTEAERRIAARALNGYELKNGTTVYFEEDGGPWTDEQHEAFAEALENYFTNGTAPNEQIKNLFERIKEFMKRIYQTMKGWTELSPQVEEFYQSLFSGELVDQARAETSNQTREQAHSEAQKEKTQNDTQQVENATTAQQDTARAISPTDTYSHTETHTKNSDIINSPDIPLEEKAQAVMDAAGEALYQIGKATTEELNKIYEQYHNEDGTAKEGWLKAPNGKATNLTENQWLTVRTPSFKKWFGDWENNPGNASKIIDKNGEPLVVYHGARTLDDFDVFNGRGSRGKIFFTDNIDVAKMFRDDYAYKLIVDGKVYNVSKRTAEDIVKTIEPIEDVEWGIGWNLLDGLDIEEFNGLLEDGTIQTGIDTFTGAENIQLEPNDNGLFEVFLNIKNPKNIDMKGKEWSLDAEYDNWTFDGGHDGIIAENVVEGGGTAEINGEDVPAATNYIVEKSNQIKSATDNAGTFDPNNPSILFQAAYHGSPYRFDRFDSSHMSEGEGNQTFGWGHYFAGKKEVAEYYRETLSSRKGHFEEMDDKKFTGRTMAEWYKHWKKGVFQKSPAEARPLFDRMAMIENLMINYDYKNTLKEARENEYSPEAIAWFEKTFEKEFQTPGQLYEVDIPGDDEMLDWDKTLNEQPEQVKKIIIDNAEKLFNFQTREIDKAKTARFDLEFGNGKYYDAETTEALIKKIFEGSADGSDLYHTLTTSLGSKKVASEYLNSIGIMGIRYLDGSSRSKREGTHNYVIFDDNDINITQTFFQTEDRDMMEEAADFENGKDYRGFIETFYGLPQEVEGLTEEQIDAWFEEFVQKAKQAVKTSEQIPASEATPAELDREFKETIAEPGALEDFVEITAAMYNEDYNSWGAVDEEDAANRDRQSEISEELRRKLTHPTWQSIFKAQGKMGPTQRKQLLTMIQNSPRVYRAIYAQVMEREDMAVSAEDSTAAALKYRITDSRRQDVDSLTPEKLRQLAEQLDIEDFAEKVRTGRAQFNDPIERAYIKQLQEQRQKTEEKLKEVDADRQEDYAYIERMAGKQFLQTFDRALKAREDITRRNEKLDKAIKAGEKDAARIARQLQRANSNYNSIVQTLEALARAQQLEVNIQEALSDERIKDYAKSAKTEATMLVRLTRWAAVEELKSHLAELKEKQQRAKELTKAKKGVVKRILRPISPRGVNADEGRAIAIIQRLVEPSMLEGMDRFIGGIEKPYLRTIFETWKVDEQLRADTLKGKAQVTKDKMTRLLSKEKFEDLTNDEKKYLFKKIPPKDWATALGLEDIINRRNENYPNINGEAEKQIALKHLPPDVYYRAMEKPFSEWTLSEAEELAKIIDDLTIQGKEIYKANIDAERRRIRAYQSAVRNTIRTVIKGGVRVDGEEAEKILGKYNEGAEGTAQQMSRRRKFKGPLFRYTDMNVYRFTRILDNGDTNGKNSAALYRRASDAYNQEMIAVDTRTERIQNLMKELGITKSELWQKAAEIDLGGDLGKTKFTASELLGFISASRDEYSREAVIYGNLLSDYERGDYQRDGVHPAELAPLELIAGDRFAQVMEAAQKLIAENPNYQKLLNAIDEDFTEGGQRLSEALVRYNNTFMPIVEKYFPMHRQAAVSAQTNDAKLAKDLMGASNGAFSLFVEKGFTNKRQDIPRQYQTAIKLDIMGVWSEAVSREEHFMAYGQLVKDLNQIYKQSRPVRDAIQRRYGQDAVKYIDKYINELANPNPEKIRNDLDKFVRTMRGNTAAAYLGWKASAIVKQFITSPAPFFAYMNPMEYWGAMIDYVAHKNELWQDITELSPHMKHRSMNMMTELVKQQAQQQFDSKAGAAISKFNERGLKGLEWIDRSCVAPGWLVLFRKEYKRLTSESASATLNEKDIRVKAAQYADDIVRLTQPSSRVDDLSPLFKGNNEFGKAFLQFTQSLNVIWQNIRYDMPQMMRERRYSQAAGTIIGYTLAGIILGAITAGFDDDDDEEMKARKIAWWATTQFTDAFPIMGSEATRLMELAFTGERHYQNGMRNLFPAFEKLYGAASTGITAIQDKDFEKLIKASAQAAEAAGIAGGLPVSGIKEAKLITGIGGEGPKPSAALGRR